MSERRLKRQLGLGQVLMLGTAGTIAAEIFVLTGHVAGMAGPLGAVAVLLVGLLCFSLALNYSELATTFPETGGALTYVREAWGDGLLSFLCGSFDCLSSTFYAALSAVGFAYSLQVFIPGLPIVLTAVLTTAAFTLLNVLGVAQVGRVQVILGVLLLVLLGGYATVGCVSPAGFSWRVFAPEGRIFTETPVRSIGLLLSVMALIFNAFVGFEIIADDAEEIKNPARNIPLGIIASLAVITLVYVLVTVVTLGTVPRAELAGAETALTQAATRFLPRYGAALMGVAGIIATLSSVNTAMLSATREAFTMSRDGVWPRFLSRMGKLRTPYAASLAVGTVVALVALIGLVDFLSYISSSGYLFVVFWASIALVRLRSRRPDLKRPFRVPLYPVTAYVAAGTCVLVIAFTRWQPLLFGAAVMACLALLYYARKPLARLQSLAHRREGEGSRLLVPVANPRTAEGLTKLATLLALRDQDTTICILGVLPTARTGRAAARQRLLSRAGRQQGALVEETARALTAANVPFYCKMVTALTVADGVLADVEAHHQDQLVLMGWPGPLSPETVRNNPVTRVLHEAHAHVAVFLNRGLETVRHILVPVGGGIHSRLAVRLAQQLAEQTGADVTAMHCYCDTSPLRPLEGSRARTNGDEADDDMLDTLHLLREIVEAELGQLPPRMRLKTIRVPSVPAGIQQELSERHYDLIVVGAAVLFDPNRELFGSVADRIAGQVSTSVLLVHRYEPAAIGWVRRQIKQMERERESRAGELSG